MRWLSALCVVLTAVLGTVEAVHIHGQWLPHNRAELHAPAPGPQLPGGEEHCPLCVAMHATLPVSVKATPHPVLWSAVALTERAVPAYESHWHFAMFSRPPPPVRL